MPSATWNSGASTDFNNTANWSAVWDSTYDLIMNNTSIVNATASGNVSCKSLTVAANYSGNLSFSGQTVTFSEGASFDGTGTLNLGNGITCNGASATFHVGSGVGTLTASSCVLTLNGTTGMTLDDDKGITFKHLVLGASALVTNSGLATTTVSDSLTPLTLGSNAVLTLSRQISEIISGAVDAFTLGAGASIAGTALLQISPAGSVTIPAITRSASIYIVPSSNSIVTLTGNISCTTFRIYAATATCTFNQNGKTITATALNIGLSSSGNFTFNFNSTVNITTFDGSGFNGGTQAINLGTSVWTVTGSWTFGSTASVSEGTSSVTFSGTTATTVTSTEKKFYDITVNKTAGTGVTFADPASLHSLTVSGTNNQGISWAGSTLTASGDINIDGSGTLDCGNGITMNGASATLHLGSTLGTVTATSCDVAMNGTTGMTLDDDKTTTFKSLTLGANAICTSSGSTTSTLMPGPGTALTLGANANFTQTSALVLRPDSAGSYYTLGAGYTWGGAGQLTLYATTTGATWSVPALTRTTGDLTVSSGTTTVATWLLTGTINIGTRTFLLRASNNRNYTLDFNDNNVTCGSFIISSDTATARACWYAGSGIISISSFNSILYNLGTIEYYYESAQITCTGNWTNPSLATVSEGTSSVTFSGTGATNTVTSANKKFYDIIINKTATAGVTFADAVDLHSLTISGTNTQPVSWTGTTLTASGNLNINGSGTLNCGNGITATGATGNLLFGSGLGAVTASSCVLTMSGTTSMVLQDSKSITFFRLILGTSAVVTLNNSSTITTFDSGATTTPLTIGTNASFTVNQQLYLYSSAAGPIYTVAGAYTLNGTGMITLRNTASTQTDLPALNYTGSGGFTLLSLSSHGPTYRLTGNFNLGTAPLTISKSSSATTTFNTNTYAITCGALTTANSNATGSLICSFSGPHSVGSFGYGSRTGTADLSFSTSSFSCAGNWAFFSGDTVTGSLSATITNTANITSASKAFYALTLNPGAGNTVTLLDALTCTNNFIITTGSFISGNFALALGADFTVAGAGTINFGTSTVTCSGNGLVTFAAGPTYTTGNAVLVLQADHSVTAGANITWSRLLTNTAGKTLTWNTGANTITVSNYTAGDIGAAAGAQIMYRSSTPGTRYRISWPIAGITASRMDFQDMNAVNGAVTANDGTSQTRGNNLNLRTFNTVSINPNNGAAAGGTPILLTDTGNGFGGICSVVIGSAAGSIIVVDTQNLTAVTVAGSGSHNVVITNGDGDSYTIIAGFTYNSSGFTGFIVLSDSSRHNTNTGNAGFSFSMAPTDPNYITSIIYDSTWIAGDQTYLQQQLLGPGDLPLVLQEWGYFGGYQIDATTWGDVQWMSRWYDPTYIKYSIWYLNYDTSQYSLIGYQQRDPVRENVGNYYAPLQVPDTPGHYQIRWLYLKDNSSYGSEIFQSFTSMSRGLDSMGDYPYAAGGLPYPYDGSPSGDGNLITTLPGYVYRYQGGSATFTLQFNGPVPAPLTYKWRRNGNYIVDDGTHFSGVETNTLVINNILLGDEGIYTCVVSSTVVSSYAYLITMIPPP